MSRSLLIIGANGFIGSNLAAHVLARTDWHIAAIDLAGDKLAGCLASPRFTFLEGDMRLSMDWIEAQIMACDVVLPLAAIANPAAYVDNPLAVFELDFEANLAVVRLCARHSKRLVFPSTSEVYGMNGDDACNEETSHLITGPISKERWIYSCSKQMMDRVIYAYGRQHGLPFTLFRPFNWFGPRLDHVETPGKSNRVVANFLSNILHGRDIVLVDGGAQKRSFLYIDDAMDALLRILENKDGCASNQIFNIGHPGNEASIAQLAALMLAIMGEFKGFEDIARRVSITSAGGSDYYGSGYQDIAARMPDIGKASSLLGWQPATGLSDGLRRTIEYYYERLGSR